MGKQKTEKKKGMPFSLALALMSAVPIVTIAISLNIYNVNQLRHKMQDGIYDELKVAAYNLGSYYTWDIINNEDHKPVYEHDYVDSLLFMNIEMTLFIGDERYMTSLKNEDGSRNEGTKADEKIAATVLAGNDYFTNNVKIGEKEYYVYYSPLYGENNTVVGMAFAGIPEDNVNNTIYATIWKTVLIAIILACVFVAIVIAMARRTKKSLKRSLDCLQKLASGDLSESEACGSVIFEIDEISNATMTLQGDLSEMIGNVKKMADELGECVADVDGLSENSSAGASQIATSVDELSEGAQNVAENVQDANYAIINMGDAIDNISDRTKTLASASGEMKDVNAKALQQMQVLMDSSRVSGELVKGITQQVSSTNDSIEKVNDAIELILEIADQTNLLSLNAAIEAARAGELGRGFAVVASEIQSLADQSANSANIIRRISEEMMTMSEKSVSMTEEVYQAIIKEQQYVQEASDHISSLSTGVTKVIDEVEGINVQAENLNSAKSDVLNNISDLSAISEENAASSQMVNVSVESIVEAIKGTKDKSGEMREMSDELTKMVQYFKLDTI